VRLLRLFVKHEWTTQVRSARFYGVTLAYLLISTAPAVIAFFTIRRAGSLLGVAFYAEIMDAMQPFATTFFAAVIAVDVVLREREENSLAVAAMAPVAATGYVLRRWLAVVILLVPVTLIPRLVAIGAAAMSEDGVPDVAPLLLGWAVHVLPLLVVVTALAIALGTIAGNTVMAFIAGLGLFTFGLGITNDLLAYARHQIDPPGDFFGLSDSFLQWAQWDVYDTAFPTAAGYPLARELELVWVHGALAIGVTALFAGIACSYLRRTKRDLRPWQIAEDHPLRSFLRVMNRFREAYAPDGGLEIPERIAVILGIVIAIGSIATIARRHNAFELLAAERFASETRGVAPMPVAIVPVAASLRGRVTPAGVIDATATLTLRNDGGSAQRELAFALNRGIGIERVTASRGKARLDRVWERVGVVLDPPLAPHESRRVAFVLRGAPGTYDFALPSASNFAAAWRRYANAKTSVDLADLSRSTLRRAASAERMLLGGPSLLPVPRYSPWETASDTRTWRHTEPPENAFVPDAVTPATALSIELDVADDFLAVDSCGSASPGHISSRCTAALGDYVLLGTRLTMTTLTGGVRLAYLPVHAAVARTHGPALAEAIRLARQSWPSFALHDRAIFVERPAFPHETYYGEWRSVYAMRALNARGALSLIPEPMFIRRKPLQPSVIAAGLIAGALRARRPVVPAEQAFFRDFYELIAAWRTGGRKGNAVEPAVGGRPITDPILTGAGDNRGPLRLAKVLSDIEYRVGAERLVAGVEDFVSAGPRPGTAKELLETIGRHGGVSLDRVYADYFLGTALPRLTLTGVTFTRIGDAWEARGTLKNEAEGEVFCPLILRTAAGSVETTVRVDTHGATPFVLRTQHLPRTLQLDPQRVVYRHAAVGTVDVVDYQEVR
jgi:ABC-type transport system involved in multi-copper enzyme maturation permease subunit